MGRLATAVPPSPFLGALRPIPLAVGVILDWIFLASLLFSDWSDLEFDPGQKSKNSDVVLIPKDGSYAQSRARRSLAMRFACPFNGAQISGGT